MRRVEYFMIKRSIILLRSRPSHKLKGGGSDNGPNPVPTTEGNRAPFRGGSGRGKAIWVNPHKTDKENNQQLSRRPVLISSLKSRHVQTESAGFSWFDSPNYRLLRILQPQHRATPLSNTFSVTFGLKSHLTSRCPHQHMCQI